MVSSLGIGDAFLGGSSSDVECLTFFVIITNDDRDGNEKGGLPSMDNGRGLWGRKADVLLILVS